MESPETSRATAEVITVDTGYLGSRVGDHATFCIQGDRYPVTIIAVLREGRTVDIQFDHARPLGTSDPLGTQRYLVWRNPTGRIERCHWVPRERGYVRAGGIVLFRAWECYVETRAKAMR